MDYGVGMANSYTMKTTDTQQTINCSIQQINRPGGTDLLTQSTLNTSGSIERKHFYLRRYLFFDRSGIKKGILFKNQSKIAIIIITNNKKDIFLNRNIGIKNSGRAEV